MSPHICTVSVSSASKPWTCSCLPHTVTGALTLVTFPSSISNSRALKHNSFTSRSGIGRQLLNCSICLSRLDMSPISAPAGACSLFLFVAINRVVTRLRRKMWRPAKWRQLTSRWLYILIAAICTSRSSVRRGGDRLAVVNARETSFSASSRCEAANFRLAAAAGSAQGVLAYIDFCIPISSVLQRLHFSATIWKHVMEGLERTAIS